MYRLDMYACVEKTLLTTIPTPSGVPYPLYWKWFCDPGFPWFTLTLIFIGLAVTIACVLESFKQSGWMGSFGIYTLLSFCVWIYSTLMIAGRCRDAGCLMKGSFEVALNTYFLAAHVAILLFFLSGLIGLGR